MNKYFGLSKVSILAVSGYVIVLATQGYLWLSMVGDEISLQLAAISLVMTVGLGILLITSLLNRRALNAIRRLGVENRIAAQNAARISAVGQLHTALDISVPVIWENDFMIGPEVLLICIEKILGEKDITVVECGSGISTLIFGYVMKKNGSGRVISFESDKEYCGYTIDRVRKHGLQDYIEVVHAPLKTHTIGSTSWQWYDTSVILETMEGEIDLLLVDGPPGSFQPLSRYPALPVFHEHLSKRAVVCLDDYKRDDEQQIVKKWLSQYNEFEETKYQYTSKGVAVLHKNSVLN